MLKNLLIVFALMLPTLAFSQEQEFHLASNQFIHEKDREAIATLDNAIARYPTDKKLKALREQIKEDQKKKQEQQQKEEQEKKEQEQQKKEQEQKEQQEKEKKEKEEQEKQQKEKEDKEKKEDEKKKPQESDESKKDEKEKQDQNLDKEKLQQMKISEDKARMILEAMKNQEKQYLQQNKRKATKSKDRTKPDW
jgi:hypothetical protein